MNRLKQVLCFITVLFLINITVPIVAKTIPSSYTDPILATKRQLSIDNVNNELAKQQLLDLRINKEQRLKVLQERGIDHGTLDHAKLDYIAAQAAVEGATIALDDGEQTADDTKNTIQGLEKALQNMLLLKKSDNMINNKDVDKVRIRLQFLYSLLSLQQQRIDVLSVTKLIAEERLVLEETWRNRLQELLKQQTQQVENEKLAAQTVLFQKQQQNWLDKLADLNEQLQLMSQQKQFSEANLRVLQFQTLEAEENVALNRLKIYLLHLQGRIQNIQDIIILNKSYSSLSALNQKIDNMLERLKITDDFVKAKIQFLTMKQQDLQEEFQNFKIINNLILGYKDQLTNVDKLKETSIDFQSELKRQMQHHLSERQVLPNFDVNGWIVFVKKASVIPSLFLHTAKDVLGQITEQFLAMEGFQLYFTLCVAFAFIVSYILLRHYLLLEINFPKESQRFSANAVFVICELIRRNLSFVYLALALCFVTFFSPQAKLIMSLAFIYLGYRIIITLSKLVLLENISDTSGKDVRLYYGLKWTFVIGAFFSALTVITYQLPVAYEVKALINRILMVFVVLMALLLLKGWTILPALIEDKIKPRQKYIFHVIRVLGLLIPLALFSNAFIGVLGYVELAWTISHYQIIFLTVLAGYLIARGVLVDGMHLMSELMIRHIKNGWLWTEAFLKPLDWILRACLFFAASLMLIQFCQLNNSLLFVDFACHLLHQKLFAIANNEITPLVLLELFMIFAVLRWCARWSREFSFRWLYAKAKDIGVRNSLAIFTQYATVIVGILVGLKLLGLDLTGFAVVMAAFAAGLGFGLRDMVNNFFSGILLLIERPFRTGDIVTLGTYEGEVVHTGIRSLTIRTWDHMDVIVPNSEMFTKSFVNWTHQDQVVRSVITLKINRLDDPHSVKKIVIGVLNENPAVLKDPPIEIFMNEINDALIEMEVRYHLKIGQGITRVGLRSEVLFAIWDQFKANNILPPNPQYDVHLRNPYLYRENPQKIGEVV